MKIKLNTTTAKKKKKLSKVLEVFCLFESPTIHFGVSRSVWKQFINESTIYFMSMMRQIIERLQILSGFGYRLRVVRLFTLFKAPLLPQQVHSTKRNVYARERCEGC